MIVLSVTMIISNFCEFMAEYRRGFSWQAAALGCGPRFLRHNHFNRFKIRWLRPGQLIHRQTEQRLETTAQTITAPVHLKAVQLAEIIWQSNGGSVPSL
jgi:hypothetical protein